MSRDQKPGKVTIVGKTKSPVTHTAIAARAANRPIERPARTGAPVALLSTLFLLTCIASGAGSTLLLGLLR